MDRIEIRKTKRGGKTRYEAIIACYNEKGIQTGHIAEASGYSQMELFYEMANNQFFEKL